MEGGRLVAETIIGCVDWGRDLPVDRAFLHEATANVATRRIGTPVLMVQLRYGADALHQARPTPEPRKTDSRNPASPECRGWAAGAGPGLKCSFQCGLIMQIPDPPLGVEPYF